ncbi:zinc ribbon domain-containing protein [Chloroflexota bacterium]
MSIASQLYRLQEIDDATQDTEGELTTKEHQLGANQAILAAREQLETGQNSYKELAHTQQQAEWEAADLGNKIKTIEEKLFSGKIVNSKELSNLQQDADIHKKQKDQIDTKTLEIIEQVEALSAALTQKARELAGLEAKWQVAQKVLAGEITSLKSALACQRQERADYVSDIDAESLTIYDKTRNIKGKAVSQVEQGTCAACRISLSSAATQRVRKGALVQCGSCGRILYMA